LFLFSVFLENFEKEEEETRRGFDKGIR
jgi:hypothetical protein